MQSLAMANGGCSGLVINNAGEAAMYKSLDAKILADEAQRKEAEKERRVSMGLPAEEENPGFFKRVFKKTNGSKRGVGHGTTVIA